MSLTTIEETSGGIREVMLESKLLAERKLFLGDITRESADEFTKAMMYLSRSNEPISVYINSFGGEVNSGLLICDIMKGCGVPINTYCVACAYSMAAVILACGTKGSRFILPHSHVLIHEPLLADGLGGSASSISMISDKVIEVRNTVNGVLAEHTGKTLEEVNKATAFDNFMTAKQAVEFGICDKITNKLS